MMMHKDQSIRLAPLPALLLFWSALLYNGWCADATAKAHVAHRFDGIATRVWEVKSGVAFSLKPNLALGGTIQYLDAVQEPIQNINRLQGRIVSTMADLSWMAQNNHLRLDLGAGIDVILDWKVKPRVECTLGVVLPVPPNPLFQNVKLTPVGWYRHRMPNGPAIKNRIASYGYSAELSSSLTPRGGAAVSFQQEFLEPADPVLDTSFLGPWPGGVVPDTLQQNRISTFYAYLYRQILEPLYLGYAFSFTDAAIDRRVETYKEPVFDPHFSPANPGPHGGPHQGDIYKWAYYPYPTPQEMLAHLISVTVNGGLGTKTLWKATVAFPLYSRRKIRYLPEYIDHNDDLAYYPYQDETFTGPLTMNASLTWNLTTRMGLEIAYDYFGFPYESWAYFTDNSYSLHTITLGYQQRF
jgi:hypothetical protein